MHIFPPPRPQIIVHDPPMFSLPKRAAFAAILKFYPSLAPAVFPPLKPRKVVEWASMDDASSYLKGRGAMFREMSPESFQFFLQHGLKRKGGSSVELTWPARAEALLFRTAPMDIPVLSPAHLGLYDAKNLPPGHFLFSQASLFPSVDSLPWHPPADPTLLICSPASLYK